jgi:predicted membrane protein
MNISWKESKTAIILIVIGFLFLINNFGVVNIGGFIWRLWPLIIIFWGISMLRKRGKRDMKDGQFQLFGDAVLSISSPYIRQSSAFGDIRIKVDNVEFAGGSASTVFGTISIDLSHVREITGYGQLDLHAVFGDIMVRIPENIPYEIKGNNLIGDVRIPGGVKIDGADYRSPGAEEEGTALVISISQVLGDIEIIN